MEQISHYCQIKLTYFIKKLIKLFPVHNSISKAKHYDAQKQYFNDGKIRNLAIVQVLSPPSISRIKILRLFSPSGLQIDSVRSHLVSERFGSCVIHI